MRENVGCVTTRDQVTQKTRRATSARPVKTRIVMSSKHVPSIWARKGDLVVAITFIIKFALALAFDYQNAVGTQRK
jgi:hypothetical protein